MSSHPKRTSSAAPTSLSNAAVIAGLRRGDDRVFDALFLAHYGRLVAIAARYVPSRAIAEEVVQEVFCRVWERRHAIHIQSTVRGYLCAMTRNAALNAARHMTTTERHEAATARTVAPHGADALVLESELAAALRRTIGDMPPRTRQAYELRTDHDLSYGEVAEAMAVSVKSVEKLLGRAYGLLRRALHGYR